LAIWKQGCSFDSTSDEVFIPETMFGSRDDNFRKMREPTRLDYPTPEESIRQMTLPEDLEVQLFASEREFPQLANPTQIEFDNRGRLWFSRAAVSSRSLTTKGCVPRSAMTSWFHGIYPTDFKASLSTPV
jgi:hypothetical protein